MAIAEKSGYGWTIAGRKEEKHRQAFVLFPDPDDEYYDGQQEVMLLTNTDLPCECGCDRHHTGYKEEITLTKEEVKSLLPPILRWIAGEEMYSDLDQMKVDPTIIPGLRNDTEEE